MNDATCTLPSEKRPRRFRARQAIDIPNDVSHQKPLVVEITTDDPEAPNIIQISEVIVEGDVCEAHAEVISNPAADRSVSRARRTLWMHGLAATVCVFLIAILRMPLSITAWQWLLDWTFPSR